MADVQSRRAENLREVFSRDEFHVESWYPKLGSHTFRTEFVKLTREQGEALLARCRANRSGDARQGAAKDPHLLTLLSELASAFDAVWSGPQRDDSGGRGCFIRLSTRSPKDAALSRPEMYPLFLAQREEVVKLYGPTIEMVLGKDGLDKLAFTRAAGRSLRVESAEEALDLMIASQRILEDLSESLLASSEGQGSPFDMSVVVRQWVDLPSEWEFRCFVVDGSLTAISQYFAKTYVPAMAKHKDAVLQALRAFFDETKGLLGDLQTYIVDYAVEWSDGAVQKIWIVEINNPPPVAGTSMFSKKDPADLDILWGRAPFEFRIVTSLPDDPMKNHRMWLEMQQQRERERGRMAQGFAAGGRAALRTSF